MLRVSQRPGAALAALAFVATLMIASSAHAEGWGTVKGTIVWGDKTIPPKTKAKVDKDQAHCLSKGDIFTNDLVVNPKNKGVRWVLVYLGDPKDARNPEFKPPIHPSHKMKPTVEIDQPCCVFEPRVLGLQVGQTLTVKNPAPIQHNFAITSLGGGPTVNPLIPPGGQSVVKGFVGTKVPTPYSCSIHGWMKGYIGVFNHPYFAVTDENGNFEIKNAPAGKFRLVMWQEKAGWVVMKSPKDIGKMIEVKDGGTTDVGKVPLKIEEE